MLFLILVRYFRVIPVIKEADITILHRVLLYGASIYFISIIVFEPIITLIVSRDKLEKASVITFVMVILLPLWWMIVLFPYLRWLSVLLAGNFFMCVIMWPLTCKLLDNIIVYTILPLILPIRRIV